MSDFTDSVEHHLKGIEHIGIGVSTKHCAECQSAYDLDGSQDDEPDDEGGFSYSGCDGCGSSLGGSRYAAHGFIIPEGEDPNDRELWSLVHLDICTDCLQYLANGEEPEHWE